MKKLGDKPTLSSIPGIGPTTAAKLRDKGYTLLGLSTSRADEVASVMGVSFKVATAWVKEAQTRVISRMEVKNAIELDKYRKERGQRISTGSLNLDKLIGGGIKTAGTTGLTGEFRTGKTQICNQVSVNCLGDIGREAIFIETEPDTFHLDRLKEMAKANKTSIDWTKLWVIPVTEVPTAKAQYLAYKKVQKLLEEGHDIGLVVVDSFTAKFRPGYSRTEMLPVRTREFCEHFLLIDFLAAKYNIAWLLTCQVMGMPRKELQLKAMMEAGIKVFPVGGHYLLHSIGTWIALDQKKSDLWRAVLFDSSYLPRGTCEFRLCKEGVRDAS